MANYDPNDPDKTTPRETYVEPVEKRSSPLPLIIGVLLALARISGETAPLLFTAFGNEFFSADVGGAMSAVPLVMYKFAGSGYENWEHLAWAGALLVTLFVLGISLAARTILLRNKIRHD